MHCFKFRELIRQIDGRVYCSTAKGKWMVFFRRRYYRPYTAQFRWLLDLPEKSGKTVNIKSASVGFAPRLSAWETAMPYRYPLGHFGLKPSGRKHLIFKPPAVQLRLTEIRQIRCNIPANKIDHWKCTVHG